MIKISNLIKRYEHKIVLNIPSLTIDTNTITGISGINGSGKTTLLKIIAGILPLSEGEVFYDNKPLNKNSLQDITYVPQEPYLFNMSIRENIEYPLKLRKIDPQVIKKKVDTYIELFDLSEVEHQHGKTLSSGEKQKTALARSLVFEPNLLLLDEPLSNVDHKSTIKIEDYIIAYQKKHSATILYVSHDQDQMKKLCHKIIDLSAII